MGEWRHACLHASRPSCLPACVLCMRAWMPAGVLCMRAWMPAGVRAPVPSPHYTRELVPDNGISHTDNVTDGHLGSDTGHLAGRAIGGANGRGVGERRRGGGEEEEEEEEEEEGRRRRRSEREGAPSL